MRRRARPVPWVGCSGSRASSFAQGTGEKRGRTPRSNYQGTRYVAILVAKASVSKRNLRAKMTNTRHVKATLRIERTVRALAPLLGVKSTVV